MQQYFSGRENKKTSDIIAKDSSNVNIENAVFANERVDASWDKARVKIHNSTFAKMGFLNSKFKQCDLSFCVFINCYFKKAYFEQTKFIGCIFINCNFDMATFLNCDFRYSTFEGCFIAYNQMRTNLPHDQENLCADICRNLSMQCLNLGEIEDYKAYLFEEKAAGEIHAIRKLFHAHNTYYSKYSFFEGVEGLFVFLRSKMSKYLWGYGEKMGALLRNIMITILVYGLVYYQNLSNAINNDVIHSRLLSALFFSACNFFSFNCQCVFTSQSLQCAELSEHILGLVFMGFFGAALFRQINRR